MDSRQTMVVAFGEEIGRKLYGVSVKLSQRYGIDIDDVAAEVMMTALDVQTRYDFVHINTVEQRVKNELYETHKYGINRYYSNGYAYREVSADAEDENGGTLLQTLAATDTYRAVDVKLVVEQVVDTLDEKDRVIVNGLFAGHSVKDIAQDLGLHCDSIYKRRRALKTQFAAALV